jgi:hypothetical protein
MGDCRRFVRITLEEGNFSMSTAFLPILGQSYNYSYSASSSGGGAGAMIFLLVELAFVVLMIAGMWKVFTKAGKPGWASIIPIYNLIVLLQIAGRPIWWIILYLIPIVNIVIAILVTVDVAKRFGKGAGFAVGMVFLPFIFYPILGFGDAQYQGDRIEPRGFAPIMPAT